MLKQPSRPHLGAAALTALALLLVGGSLAGSARAADYVRHEVIVGYTQGPVARVTAAFTARISTSSRAAPAPDSRVLRLAPNESVADAVARLRRQPGILYAEPNYIAHAAGGWYPNDGGRGGQPGGWKRMQWNMLPGVGVNAPQAWANLIADHRPGGRGVVVAILDTGVAYRNWHEFRQSPDFTGTRFVAPYDFIAGNRSPLDRNGHGTFVAGIVGEATNNGFALTGLAYGASIMPVRVLDAGGLGDEATIARGIRYAVTHGASVINLSLEFLPTQVASGSAIPQIISALSFARARGVTVVAAAGNDESPELAYPARARGVIAVGATTRDRCLAVYSNGGTGLDLVAPGGGNDAIIPSDPNCHPGRNLPPIYQLTLSDPPHWGRFGYPDFYVGTSMSAPEVAATAALVIASGVIGPHPSPDQIRTRLEQTAAPLGGAAPDHRYGFGLVDAGAATLSSPSPPAAPTAAPPGAQSISPR